MAKVLIPAIVSVISIAAGVAITWFVKPSAVELTFPGGVAMKMDGSQPIAHSELLEDIFSEKFSRDGFVGWLAEKDIYSIRDERLVDAINKRLCESIPEQPFEARIQAARACAEENVATSLRMLVARRQIPFHYVGTLVKVGIPSLEDQPPVGRANVCAESDLLDKEVELTNHRNGRRIEIEASWGRYPCTGYATFPDIQLNFDDAQELFPGALDEYQEAVAVILN